MNFKLLVYLCFFLSGVSALIYEVVWGRLLISVFGASLYAVATIGSVFLAGLALGALFAGRFAGNTFTRLRIYGLLELLVGVLGFGLPFLFAPETLQPLWRGVAGAIPGDYGSYLLRLLFAALLLLPASMLMGATFPVLVGVVAVGETEKSDPTQALYASNTVGGAVGSILAGFILLPALGLRATSALAASLNVIAAIGAFVASLHPEKFQPPAVEVAVAAPLKKRAYSKEVMPPSTPATIFGAAFVCGIILLTLEVSWSRWFSLLLGSSVYSLSAVLCVFLVSLAAGAWVVHRYLHKIGNRFLLIATAYFLSCTYILITMYSANELPWLYVWLCQVYASLAGGLSFAASLYARITLVAIVIMPPVFLMGMVFPLLLGGKSGDKTKFVGAIYAVNTAGSILGALLAGFVLIPSLSALAGSGIQWTIILTIAAQIAMALWCFMEWARAFVTDPDTRMIVVGIAVFVAVAVVGDVALFRPHWNPNIMSAGASFYSAVDTLKMDRDGFLASLGVSPGRPSPTIFYREGLNGTVTVARDRRRNIIFLKLDGKVEAALPEDPQQPTQGADTTTHLLLGSLPPALVSRQRKSVLVIGYGSGTTAGAVLANETVGSLKVAELESAVLAAAKYFAPSSGNPLSQRMKVQVALTDGRYDLAANDAKYDAIICQPSDPWVAGSADLFTADFWRLTKSKLNAGGVVSQWIQMYSIEPAHFAMLCRTFKHVFPNCSIVCPPEAGECVLLGFNSSSPVTPATIINALQGQTLRPQHLPAGYQSLNAALAGAIVLDAVEVGELAQYVGGQTGQSGINTDDHNYVEYAVAQSAMTQQQKIGSNIELLRRFCKAKPLSR